MGYCIEFTKSPGGSARGTTGTHSYSQVGSDSLKSTFNNNDMDSAMGYALAYVYAHGVSKFGSRANDSNYRSNNANTNFGYSLDYLISQVAIWRIIYNYTGSGTLGWRFDGNNSSLTTYEHYEQLKYLTSNNADLAATAYIFSNEDSRYTHWTLEEYVDTVLKIRKLYTDAIAEATKYYKSGRDTTQVNITQSSGATYSFTKEGDYYVSNWFTPELK